MDRANLTKKEIVAAVAEKAQLTKKQASFAVDAVFEAVADGVVEGKLVRMSGLGTIGYVEKAERRGHNPRTGEAMLIPAHKAVKFKTSKDVKARL